ncbi:c-type cytochrome [Marinibactrum halimedae]|uniref:Cytochrome c domain-containing protein n=2 Tax=Marinibactrum halimedae TaxID=1444977 RepID=A0AA37WMF6_9GAMM|nr:c-type cytochrome [Marinibactrum halimedae]MCD9457879.1 cytochrome c [Marinibactrum halimedae]GLS26300.1 hypothetical protein GCM10007877_20150 [Marinibactrum halimedae]
MNGRRILANCLIVVVSTLLSFSVAALDRDLLVCSVCHGADLQGNKNTEAPNIAVLPSWYIRQQLHSYQREWRGAKVKDKSGQEMRTIALSLTDEHIQNIVEKIAHLNDAMNKKTLYEKTIHKEISHKETSHKEAIDEEVKSLATNIKSFNEMPTDLLSQGKKLYQQCSACHGSDGLGREVVKAPPLVHQPMWYLKKQLNNYQAGIRGYHEQDSSGQQMTSIAQGIRSQDDIDAVVTFIKTL